MATVSQEPKQRTASSEQRVPRLYPGDRLTRSEFERRYAAMPQLKNAELIEGVVYVPSPISHAHAFGQATLIGWLSQYSAATAGVEVGGNASLRLDLDNEPQPDAYLRIVHAGRSRVDPDGYLTGAPELVAEVAVSSTSMDLHSKLQVYRRNGVPEYLVWRVEDRGMDWFLLREGRYDLLPKTAGGIYQSQAFPGLWLDPEALLRGDLQSVAKTLQAGLATSEHETFVASLPPRGNDETQTT